MDTQERLDMLERILIWNDYPLFKELWCNVDHTLWSVHNCSAKGVYPEWITRAECVRRMADVLVGDAHERG